MSEHYTLEMAQAVGQRLLDPATAAEVTVTEIMDAGLAVGLALAAGEVEPGADEAFSALIQQALRAKLRESSDRRRDVAAWIAVEEAETRLPRSATSASRH